MPRKQYPPLSPDQRAWLARWARRQDATLQRVMDGLRHLQYDGGNPTYRRVYDAQLALRALAAGGRPDAGIWAPPPRRQGEPPPDLTGEQLGHLAGVASDAARDLRRAAEYFDHAGSPCRMLADAVRRALDDLRAIGPLLHRRPENMGGRTPEPPADPALDAGAGI